MLHFPHFTIDICYCLLVNTDPIICFDQCFDFWLNELGGWAATPTTWKLWWTVDFWTRSGDHGMYFKEVQKRGKHTHTYQQWFTNWWKYWFSSYISPVSFIFFFPQHSMNIDMALHMHIYTPIWTYACTLMSMNAYAWEESVDMEINKK